jgi:hypothetical protein
MEAVAWGNYHMLFNNMLAEGATYDFRGVCFAPIYENVMHTIFRLGNEYFVQLTPDSQVNPPDRVVWFWEGTRTIIGFEDVGRQPADNFAGNSQMNLWLCFDQLC